MGVTTVTYTYRGEDQEITKNFKVNLASSVTIANAIIWAQEIAKKAEDITDGQLLNISMSTDVSLPAGIRTAPVDGSRAEAKAYIAFKTVAGYPTSLAVPTRLEDIVSDGSHAINTTEAGPVKDFVDALIDGINLATATPVAGTGTVGAVDTHADRLNAVTKAKEIFG